MTFESHWIRSKVFVHYDLTQNILQYRRVFLLKWLTTRGQDCLLQKFLDHVITKLLYFRKNKYCSSIRSSERHYREFYENRSTSGHCVNSMLLRPIVTINLRISIEEFNILLAITKLEYYYEWIIKREGKEFRWSLYSRYLGLWLSK